MNGRGPDFDVERFERVVAGSSTVLLGPAGGGKSLITLQFVAETIRQGGKAAMFIFDEELGLLFNRAKPLGFDLHTRVVQRYFGQVADGFS